MWFGENIARRCPALATAVTLAGAAAAQGQLSIESSFQASTFFTSGFFPPDTMGAVGPDHFVELINGAAVVYDKLTGNVLDSDSLNGFWMSAGVDPSGAFSFDPRILYDDQSGRWFAAAVDNAGGVNNFLVAVSQTADPLDGWTGFKIDADFDNAQWADFPTLGINPVGVYVAANMFTLGGGSAFTHLLVLPKADLLQAAPTVANRTLLQDLEISDHGFTLQPVVDLDRTTNGDYPIPLTEVTDLSPQLREFFLLKAIGTVEQAPVPVAPQQDHRAANGK